MDSRNEEISSIFERFRQNLLGNTTQSLVDEFNQYRATWSTNKFRMFLTNVLVVMRTWADSQLPIRTPDQEEDWDAEENGTSASPIAEKMKASAQCLFLAIVDYLQAAAQAEGSDGMSTDVEVDMWKRMVANKWTMDEKFYTRLHNEHVRLPARLTRPFHNDLYTFYTTTEKWSSATKILLIELGFVYLLIHDNLFLGCNHILVANRIFNNDDYVALTRHSQADPAKYSRRLITSMNTPEKMKIFLDYYPDVDLTELTPGNIDVKQQRTPLTIFDRLLKMEPYYYETIDHAPLAEAPDFSSDRSSVRAANMLHLFQKLVCSGAKLSITLDGVHYQNHHIPLFITTLGFYLLSILHFRDHFVIGSRESADDSDNDIIPSTLTTTKPCQDVSPLYLDTINTNYIHYLVKRASTFPSLFRVFFFNHLNVCCPLVHKPAFQQHATAVQNVRLRALYDELLEKRTFLTLKQRCRLVIKESVRRYPLDVQSLGQLPTTLQHYLSFDLLNPNFVPVTLNALNQANGRVKPSFFDELQFHEHGLEQINGHNDWEDQIPDEMDYDNDHDEMDDDDEDAEQDYVDNDPDLFDEEGLYSDNDDDDDEW